MGTLGTDLQSTILEIIKAIKSINLQYSTSIEHQYESADST